MLVCSLQNVFFGQFTRREILCRSSQCKIGDPRRIFTYLPARKYLRGGGGGAVYVTELCTKSSDLISTTQLNGRKMKHLLFKSSKWHFKADQGKVQEQFRGFTNK